MAEVTFSGIGQNQPANGKDVSFGGLGTPVFGGSLGFFDPGAAFQQDINATRGTEFEQGASGGRPVFNTETRQNGAQQLDPNDNRSLQIENYPATGVTFPGVATTQPNIVPDPNSSRNVDVELVPGGVIFPSTQVVFITGAVRNVG